MTDTKPATRQYRWIDPDGEPDFPDLTQEICPDCYGDSDPIDDLYYCGTCGGRGWVSAQHFDSPYLDYRDFLEWHRKAVEVWGDDD